MRPLLISMLLVAVTPFVRALTPDVLHSTDAISAHVAGRFREVAGFEQSASGQYFVFDRGAHAVFGVDQAGTSSWEIIQIGAEPGRIIDPTAFSLASDGSFVVADAPRGQQRIQVFTPAGFVTAGFTLPGRARSTVRIGNYILNGIGSLEYTGRSILISQPEHGTLITEYALNGTTIRSFGVLRRTGHEDDTELHIALNTGIPLLDPTGGFFFVFQAGVPVIRKYDDKGELIFERLIQGLEIDAFVHDLPAVWPVRKTADGEFPVVTPTIRAAAVDHAGRLWVAFVLPYLYVFDPQGDKIRTLQLRGAGIIAPNSLFFGTGGRLLVTPGLYEFSPDAP